MIVAGIDLGTAAIKIVFIDQAGTILSANAFDAVPDNICAIENIFNKELERLAINRSDLGGIATTGYGKRFFQSANLQVDEITALAKGVFKLSNGEADIVLNVGGQDVKLVEISKTGKVLDFKMNDKCAAGTGRFLEMMSNILGVPLKDFQEFGSKGSNAIKINCTCAVFAETEIASLLYEAVDKGDIIAGIHHAVAVRLSDFMQNIPDGKVIYFDGGLAQNKHLADLLVQNLFRDVRILVSPQFTSAVGAAFELLEAQ